MRSTGSMGRDEMYGSSSEDNKVMNQDGHFGPRVRNVTFSLVPDGEGVIEGRRAQKHASPYTRSTATRNRAHAKYRAASDRDNRQKLCAGVEPVY